VARPLDAAPAFERVARDNERHERHDQNGEREEEETAAHENGWRNKPLPAFGHPPHYVERDELLLSGMTEVSVRATTFQFVPLHAVGRVAAGREGQKPKTLRSPSPLLLRSPSGNTPLLANAGRFAIKSAP